MIVCTSGDNLMGSAQKGGWDRASGLLAGSFVQNLPQSKPTLGFIVMGVGKKKEFTHNKKFSRVVEF